MGSCSRLVKTWRLRKSDGQVHYSVWNAAVSCENHHERLRRRWASPSEEEEERKKERRKKNNLPVLRVPGAVLSGRFFATRGVLLVMKTLEDERYVVIKAYKCTVSEIWRDSFVLACIACTSYPYIQSLPTLWYRKLTSQVHVLRLTEVWGGRVWHRCWGLGGCGTIHFWEGH